MQSAMVQKSFMNSFAWDDLRQRFCGAKLPEVVFDVIQRFCVKLTASCCSFEG